MDDLRKKQPPEVRMNGLPVPIPPAPFHTHTHTYIHTHTHTHKAPSPCAGEPFITPRLFHALINIQALENQQIVGMHSS